MWPGPGLQISSAVYNYVSVGRLPDVKRLVMWEFCLFPIGWMAFLAQTLDNADPFFAPVTTPGFYLHHVEVADQNLASGNLYIFLYTNYQLIQILISGNFY